MGVLENQIPRDSLKFGKGLKRIPFRHLVAFGLIVSRCPVRKIETHDTSTLPLKRLCRNWKLRGEAVGFPAGRQAKL
jgi:hypothetical protein